VAAKPNNQASSQEVRARRAFGVMADIRGVLSRRLVNYVLAHENRLQDEAQGEDSYSFTLQQMEEQVLAKLHIVERAMCELSRADHRDSMTTTTTYETVEVSARREELPQKIADALAEHGDSDFLDMCVLRADEKQAEVMLVLAREDCGLPPASSRPEKLERGEQGEQGDNKPGDASGGSEN
jgi:hypothetical protein